MANQKMSLDALKKKYVKSPTVAEKGTVRYVPIKVLGKELEDRLDKNENRYGVLKIFYKNEDNDKLSSKSITSYTYGMFEKMYYLEEGKSYVVQQMKGDEYWDWIAIEDTREDFDKDTQDDSL